MVGIKSLKEVKKRHWKWLVIAGMLGSFFPPFLFAIAQTEIDSAVASILNSLTPLNTFILGILFFSIIVTRRQIVGMSIGLLGTVILIATGAEFNPHQNYWYAGLILISSMGYAININVIKKYLMDVSALAVTTGSFLVIVGPALVILYFTGFFEAVFSSPEMQHALVYVLLLSFFGTAIAKVLFNKLVQIASPVFAASVTYTMPLIAVSWGLLDGEVVSGYQLFGGAAILLGVYLTNRNEKRASRKQDTLSS